MQVTSHTVQTGINASYSPLPISDADANAAGAKADVYHPPPRNSETIINNALPLGHRPLTGPESAVPLSNCSELLMT